MEGEMSRNCFTMNSLKKISNNSKSLRARTSRWSTVRTAPYRDSSTETCFCHCPKRVSTSTKEQRQQRFERYWLKVKHQLLINWSIQHLISLISKILTSYIHPHFPLSLCCMSFYCLTDTNEGDKNYFQFLDIVIHDYYDSNFLIHVPDYML